MNGNPARGRRIGVLVPYTNTNLEPDLQMMCPAGCTLHFARLGDYDSDAIPGAAQMARLGSADLDEPLRLIAGVRPAAVLYGCTSATLTLGTAHDDRLAARIRASCGAVALTAAGALAAAIDALRARRIGLASPYVKAVNDRAISFLAGKGIETVARADIGRALGNHDQGALTPDDVFELAVRAVQPGVEALVLSCTDMRAAEAVARIEAETGLPVVTSNQAMVLALCRSLGLPRPAGAPGRLFDRLTETARHTA